MDSSILHVYEYIYEKSGKSILVDSSKNISWIQESIKQTRDKEIESFVIYLKRYPPAMVASWFRKYPDKGLDRLTEMLAYQNKQMDIFFKSLKIEKIEVLYDEIVDNPSYEFRNIFQFVGETFNKEYLEYYKFDHHQIAGNSGTASLIRKFKSGDANLGANLRMDYYINHPLAIKKDDRWKQELNQEQIEFILDTFQNAYKSN